MAIKTNTEICKSCQYGKFYCNQGIICDYYCMTGKRRGCAVGECDKYKIKTKLNNNFTKGDIKR